MMSNSQTADRPFATIEEEASHAFVQRLQGDWTEHDQAALESRLAGDRAYADAYRRVEQSWSSLESHAEAPEVMAYREEALVYARRANARRWLSGGHARNRWRLAAAVAAVALVLATTWQVSPYGYRPGRYQTGIGEQHVVDLDDRSRITLDAATRLQVRYTKDARTVRLLEGQAQFSVAHDPTRPFKVEAGDRTIVALGTVFTVEYINQKVHVAMMQGRVAVVPRQPGGGSLENAAQPSSELTAGEELRVGHDGRVTVTPQADLEAATAWREGKVIFRTESLGDAVQRLNRYSHLQIEIEGEVLAAKRISGVFETGDTQGFVSAVQQYLPVTADYTGTDTVKLRMK